MTKHKYVGLDVYWATVVPNFLCKHFMQKPDKILGDGRSHCKQ